MSATPKLCLNMIVRNEAERIERCLASVRPWISSYVIFDTGSTDDTKAIVRRVLDGVAGTLMDIPFVDFSQARNAALYEARRDYFTDFILLVDADMELVVEDQNWLLNLPARLVAFSIEQRAGIHYHNTRLISRREKAVYIGSTHEYLQTEHDVVLLNGLHFIDHADGANRPGKFERDIGLLRGDIQRTNATRSLYYLAQSYRDAGDHEAAATLYRARALLGGFDEEVWHAKLSEARCYRTLGRTDRFRATALQAWNMRPQRLEPIADLTRDCRDAGQHRCVLYFGHQTIDVPVPDDRLFVELDAYGPLGSIAEDVSISAFYTPGAQARGFELCDWLATHRDTPPARRDQARANLRHYAPRLDDIARDSLSYRCTLVFTELRPPLEPGWHACNPSVCAVEGAFFVNVRAVNYTQGGGRYELAEDGVVRTTNYLAALEPDPSGGFRLDERGWQEIDAGKWLGPPLGYEGLPLYPHVRGLEDIRLFPQKAELWFSACVRELNIHGLCEQYIGRIGGQDRSAVDQLYKLSNSLDRHEKNWTPIVSGFDTERFVYDFDGAPPRDRWGSVLVDHYTRPVPPLALDHLRGGTQAVGFELDDIGGFLCCTHEVVETPGGRHYLHRWVLLDNVCRPVRISRPFKLHGSPVEFAAGLAWHPTKPDVLVVAYGVEDREAYLAELPAAFVKEMLS